MTRKPIVVRAVGRIDTEVSGAGVFEALTSLDIPKMRPVVRSGNVWLIPSNRVEDLYAWCAYRKIPVVETL